jgi:hypothetical protein
VPLTSQTAWFNNFAENHGCITDNLGYIGRQIIPGSPGM